MRRAGRSLALSAATATVSGSVEALDRGRRVRLAGCGSRRSLDLPAGTGLVTAAGATMRPYLLSLRSPGDVRRLGRRPRPASSSRRAAGGDGSRTDVRLALDRPAWLVLGEGYSRGLAGVVPLDGRQGARPRRARADRRLRQRLAGRAARAPARGFWFAPQRLATVSYVISALAGLAILLAPRVAAVAWPPRPRRGRGRTPPWRPRPPADSDLRLDWRAALAVGIGVGLVSGWFFAVRAGRAARRRRRVPRLAGRDLAAAAVAGDPAARGDSPALRPRSRAPTPVASSSTPTRTRPRTGSRSERYARSRRLPARRPGMAAVDRRGESRAMSYPRRAPRYA